MSERIGIDRDAPIKVTVSDPETGEVLETKTVDRDDYILITTGRRYVKSMQMFGQTHMLAVAVQKDPV